MIASGFVAIGLAVDPVVASQAKVCGDCEGLRLHREAGVASQVKVCGDCEHQGSPVTTTPVPAASQAKVCGDCEATPIGKRGSCE